LPLSCFIFHASPVKREKKKKTTKKTPNQNQFHRTKFFYSEKKKKSAVLADSADSIEQGPLFKRILPLGKLSLGIFSFALNTQIH